MNFILVDLKERENFLPLTHTRSVADMRCGVLTLREKWERYLQISTHTLTIDYLQSLYTLEYKAQNYFINATIFPTTYLVQELKAMASNTVLKFGEIILAVCLNEIDAKAYSEDIFNKCQVIQFQFEVLQLKNSWDIFSLNDRAIKDDYDLITLNKSSIAVSKTNTLIGNQIFLEPGAKVEACTLNSSTGPIYIGKDAEIMEGSIIRGPLALCEGAQLKLATKIYGATTIGPGCKVGGEVNNAVFFANSSKAHDGFIGNSVIGEWCNLGADTNNSNLKNNYEEVKLWSESKSTFVKTELQFCGLIMGDHSKCGINTMFNTGTVVGVSANIFGAGFPRNFIPSFSWGGASGFADYKIDKALQTMQHVFARRKKTLTDLDKELYTYLYEATKSQRIF
jgi:UDP-N-acetylglucosamine diphosphorylase/glucosamine-1-phosphate N-acetyltransferase